MISQWNFITVVTLVSILILANINAHAQTLATELRQLKQQLENGRERIDQQSRELNRGVDLPNHRGVMEVCWIRIGQNRYHLENLDLSELTGLAPQVHLRLAELKRQCVQQAQILRAMSDVSARMALADHPAQMCGPAQVAEAAFLVLHDTTLAQLVSNAFDQYQSTTLLTQLLREYEKNYDLFKNPDQVVDDVQYRRWNRQFFALLNANPHVVTKISLDTLVDITFQGKVTYSGIPALERIQASFFVQNFWEIFARLDREDVLQGTRLEAMLKRIYASNASVYKDKILQELFDFMRTENDLIWLSRMKDDYLKAATLSSLSPSMTMLTEAKTQIESTSEMERNIALRMKILIQAFQDSGLIPNIDQELMSRIQQNQSTAAPVDRKNDFSYSGLRHSKIGDIVKGMIKYETKLTELAQTDATLAEVRQRHQSALALMGQRIKSLAASEDHEENWHVVNEDFRQTLIDLDTQRTLFDDLIATTIAPAPVP